MKRELFGTDGIRGVAGEPPLDPPVVFAVGAALGRWIASHHLDPEVVIGTDTRESGQWIAGHVAGGLALSGVRARFAGLTTTPGVAYLARTGPFAAGVMISASHNPYRDNGIKVLDHSGFKLPDAQEHAIEQDIFAVIDSKPAVEPVPLAPDDTLDRLYVDYLAGTFPQRLDGLRIIVDAAHGSASFIGPQLFERLGARVRAIGSSPNGRNINLNCGSLHLDRLREEVLRDGSDLGIAFDGDADRALFVAHSGRIVDGDAVMLITAEFLHSAGRLAEADGAPVVIATVMSNIGLERALAERGIGMVRTPVGDKYVLEEMLRRGARLGGEQSGHVIFRDYATTGDGLLTALRVLEVVRATGKTLDELSRGMTVFPQKLVNVKVSERKPLEDLPRVRDAIREAEQSFGAAGRVLVRFSGTEPLARVMVEGPEEGQVNATAEHIAGVIRAELGG
jgi:phosphoglucosamine mutase